MTKKISMHFDHFGIDIWQDNYDERRGMSLATIHPERFAMTKQPNQLLTKRVNAAASAVMKRNKCLSYPELFIEMGILSRDNYTRWTKGSVPYLERVITCNLTKLSRIVTAVRRLAREQNYWRTVKKKPKRRYSKTNNPFLEEEYSAVYGLRIKSKEAPAKVTLDSATPTSDGVADGGKAGTV